MGTVQFDLWLYGNRYRLLDQSLGCTIQSDMWLYGNRYRLPHQSLGFLDLRIDLQICFIFSHEIYVE